MVENTIFVSQVKLSEDKPFYLEFNQLKEYYNFRRKFNADKTDKNKQGKWIQNEYYLIDKNWLNEWKQFVGYNEIHQMNLNRDMNDKDYNLFITIFNNKNKENKTKLFPLDNSELYFDNGEINPLAEFIIIDKKCNEAFGKSRQNMVYNVKEKHIILKFLKDKIILNISDNIRIICFRNGNIDEEIIIVFIEQKNKDKILSDIEQQDFKYWLKDRSFESDGPDELQFQEQECKIKIINKNLKLKKNKLIRNSIKPNTTYSNTTLLKVKYFQIPGNLKESLRTNIEENFSQTIVALKKMDKNKVFQNIQRKYNNQNLVLGQQQMNNNNIANNNNFIKMNPNQVQNIPVPNNQNNILFNNRNNQFNNFSNNNVNDFSKNNVMNNMQMKQNNFGIGFNQMNMITNPNMMMNQNMMMQMNNNPNMFINQMFQMNNMNLVKGNSDNNIQNNLNLNHMNNLSSPNLNHKMNLNSNEQEKKQNFSNPELNPFTKGIIFPHKAGLMNVGQSCYMNATIECLSNIKSLSYVLLQNYGRYDIDKQPLCASLSALLFDLFHTKETYIEPKIFKEIIGKLNPLFEGNHAADAKDLIFFLVETLHNELLPTSQNNNENEIDFMQQEIDSQDEQKMFNDFIKEFNLKRTIISEIFYGINRSIMYCSGCRKYKYSFQTFNLLIFPLKKVKEYKMKKTGSARNLDLNLYDAFYCEQVEEKLEGENMIYCNICKKLTPGSHKQDIYGMPRILIIILNRGKNNQDFNEEFRFDEMLDFSKTNIIVNQNSYKKFYLCGIITHLGESGSGGHFIAYCRNNINDKFMCYNDASATPVSSIDAMASKISNNDIEKKTPYILLYHYMM